MSKCCSPRLSSPRRIMPRTPRRPGCRDGFCDRAICRAATRLRSHRNFSRRCSACNGAVFQSSRTNFLMLGTKHKTGLFLFRETCLRSWTSAPHADTSRPLLHRNESHRGAVEQRLAHRVKYKSRPWRQRAVQTTRYFRDQAIGCLPPCIGGRVGDGR